MDVLSSASMGSNGGSLPADDRLDADELMDTIAANIRAFRREAGWSQKELGARANLSLKAIGEIERGNRAVSVRSLDQIAHALDVPAAELLRAGHAPDGEIEEELARFAIHARRIMASPELISLCTKMLEASQNPFDHTAAT